MTTTLDIEILDDETLEARLTGRLDVVGVDAVETRFTAALVPSGKNALVDLSGVDFAASLGIRMFVAVGRSLARDGRKLALHSASDTVAEVLEMAALDQLMIVAPDVESARVALAAG